MDRVGLWAKWDYGQSRIRKNRIMDRVGLGRIGLWAE